MDKKEANNGKGSNFNLYICACISNLAYYAAGSVTTWTSPTLFKLMAPDSWLHITEEQGSWIGSLFPLGAALGPILGGALLDKIGRKLTLMLDMSLFLTSWTVLAVATNVQTIYAGRIIGGLAVGVVFTALPVYIAEISTDRSRGSLGGLMQFFLSSGYMVEYCIGPFVSYLQLIIVSLVMPLIFLVLFAFMPESPYYLVSCGQRDKAVKNLRWLRGNPSDRHLEKEISSIERLLSNTINKASMKDLVTRGNLTAVYLTFGLFGIQQFSGINAILFYTQPIFDKTGTTIPSSLCSILVGGVKLISAFFVPFLAKRFSIKILLIASAAGMAISQGMFGLYFYLDGNGIDVSGINWLPVSSLLGYIIVFAFGFGPMPWAVMGEMFPPDVKAAASASGASFNWLLGFLISKFFANISSALGVHCAFWLFACCCVGGMFFVIFLLPDTRGLSLQEIQDLINRRKTPPCTDNPFTAYSPVPGKINDGQEGVSLIEFKKKDIVIA